MKARCKCLQQHPGSALELVNHTAFDILETQNTFHDRRGRWRQIPRCVGIFKLAWFQIRQHLLSLDSLDIPLIAYDLPFTQILKAAA